MVAVHFSYSFWLWKVGRAMATPDENLKWCPWVKMSNRQNVDRQNVEQTKCQKKKISLTISMDTIFFLKSGQFSFQIFEIWSSLGFFRTKNMSWVLIQFLWVMRNVLIRMKNQFPIFIFRVTVKNASKIGDKN